MKIINPEVKHGIVNRKVDTYYRGHGWPTICKDDRGVLYVVASDFRMEHCSPDGKNSMYVSINNGETWTPPIIVNDSYLDDRDAGIVYMGDGKMCLSWFSEKDQESYKHFEDYEWLEETRKRLIVSIGAVGDLLPEEHKREGSYIKLSDDYGFTWSERIRVPVTCPHGPNIMKDGTLLYLGRDQYGDCGEENLHKIVACASKDGGKTWEIRGTVPPCDGLHTDFAHEPHVVELPNGRLLGAIRVHCRPAPFDPADTVYTTFSDDGGYTWSEPKAIGVNGLPPHLYVHSSGAVICSYAHRGGRGNQEERAVVSYDNGETWEEDYVLFPNVPGSDLGYPATTELPDGSLITVYYQVYENDDLPSVLYTKWKLNER